LLTSHSGKLVQIGMLLLQQLLAHFLRVATVADTLQNMP
jgi:hypothetical protein